MYSITLTVLYSVFSQPFDCVFCILGISHPFDCIIYSWPLARQLLANGAAEKSGYYIRKRSEKCAGNIFTKSEKYKVKKVKKWKVRWHIFTKSEKYKVKKVKSAPAVFSPNSKGCLQKRPAFSAFCIWQYFHQIPRDVCREGLLFLGGIIWWNLNIEQETLRKRSIYSKASASR